MGSYSARNPEGFVEDFEKLIDDEELKKRILVKGKKDRDDAIDSYRKELLEKFQTEYVEKWITKPMKNIRNLFLNPLIIELKN
nr:hypothetical protein [Marinitoga lauensis]